MRKFMLIAVLSALQLGSLGQSKIPPPGKPKDFILPAVERWKLSNGLAVSTIPYGSIPKVYVELVVKTGQVHEPAGERWLARFTGKLMEQGTALYDLETISKKAAAMGGELSIAVASESVTIGGSVLSEFAPQYISLIAEVLQRPAFAPDAADRIKNDLKRELNVRKAQPGTKASEQFFAIVYKDNPYSNQLPTEVMVDAFTIEKAKSFYEQNFGAQRSAIYVAGRFDSLAVKEAINAQFGKWKEGPAVRYPIAKPLTSNELAVVELPNAAQTIIMLGGPVVDPTHADYTPLEVTNSLLGGSFGSRITANIREDKGYTYSPYSAIQNRQKAGVWYERADVTSEHTAASLKEIKKEMQKIQAEPVSAAELKGIQHYEAGSFVINNSSAPGMIDQLSFMDMNGLKMSYLTNRIKDIYSVTPAQVQAIAKRYFNYSDMTLVLVGDKKHLDTQLNNIRQDREKAKKAF